MRQSLSRQWPLFVTLGLFAASSAFLYVRAVALTGGSLVYILDDPYIHMAMARNLAERRLLGVTPYEFSFCTSSPLWTFLLGLAFKVSGPRETIPLLLNLAACLVFVFWLHRTLRGAGIVGWREALVSTVIVFSTSMLTLSFTGMEHSLHVFLSLAFAWRIARLSTAGSSHPGKIWLDGLLAAALVTARYEGLFLAVPASMALLWRGRRLQAAAVALGATLPVISLGVWSQGNGWHFFPNSLLLKANLPSLSILGTAKKALAFYYQLAQSPELLVLLPSLLLVLYLICRKKNGIGEVAFYPALLFVFSTVLHLQFARVNLLRYESYLVALGLFALGVSIPLIEKNLRDSELFARGGLLRLLPLVALLAVFSPLVLRGARAFTWIPRASRNIYEQQRQMAGFLGKFYRAEAVAANDIGAINWRTELRCLDLWGLADREVLDARRGGRFNPEFVDSLSRARGVKAAILYERWFDQTGGLPGRWVPVGWWRIKDNIVCGDDQVTFYAVDPAHAATLIERLRLFDPFLPERVIRGGAYTVGVDSL